MAVSHSGLPGYKAEVLIAAMATIKWFGSLVSPEVHFWVPLALWGIHK